MLDRSNFYDLDGKTRRPVALDKMVKAATLEVETHAMPAMIRPQTSVKAVVGRGTAWNLPAHHRLNILSPCLLQHHG